MKINARVERKLSQDQLAEKTGFTRPRISDIENGKVNFQLIEYVLNTGTNYIEKIDAIKKK